METGKGSTAADSSGNYSERTGLTDDLLIEIFSHLPLKPLFRFKCVSKAWLSLISDYSLQAGILESLSGVFYYARRVDENNSVEQTEYRYTCLSSDHNGNRGSSRHTPMNVSLDFLPFYPNFRIVDCSNGLLLCLTGVTRGVVYYICNPLLRRWVPLPKPQTKAGFVNGRLVYNHMDSPNFKVLLGSNFPYGSPGHIVIEVFSSCTGKWDQLKVLHQPSRDYIPHFGGRPDLFFKEGLYYLGYPFHLLRVDLRKGDYRVIELPDKVTYVGGSLHESGGNLFYAHLDSSYFQNAMEHRLNIWLLKDYTTNDWIEVHKTCITNLETDPGPSCPHTSRRHLEVLAFGADTDLVFLIDHCKIFSCDLAAMRVQGVCDFGSDPGKDGDSTDQKFGCYPFIYTPCLNTLEGHKQCNGAHC